MALLFRQLFSTLFKEGFEWSKVPYKKDGAESP
jgi:hypothetical protein